MATKKKSKTKAVKKQGKPSIKKQSKYSSKSELTNPLDPRIIEKLNEVLDL